MARASTSRMAGYMLAEVDSQILGAKYTCVKCEKILRDPMQTVCGHRYCKACVEDILRSPGSLCLTCKNYIKVTEVFIDTFAKREILSLEVHCLSHADGCAWRGQLRDMECHQASCPFEKIPCENKECPKVVLRKNLQQHMQRDCSYRKERCDQCGECVAFCQMEEHQLGTCPEYPIQCPKCKDQVARSKMSQHLDPDQGDCNAVEGPCRFHALGCRKGNKPMQKKERQLHLQQSVAEHVNLLLKFTKHQSETIIGLSSGASLSQKMTPAIMEEMDKKLKDAMMKIEDEMRKFSELRPQLEKHALRIKRLEDCVTSEFFLDGDLVPDGNVTHSGLTKKTSREDLLMRITNNESQIANHELLIVEKNRSFEEQQAEIENLTQKLQSAQETIKKLERMVESQDHMMNLRNIALSDLEEYVRQTDITSYNGVLLWRIDNFTKRKNDAISGRQQSFYSPCFYTSRHGYKMCARIYLNGDGMGRGTHISVFFAVMRGQYDALLRWPFRQKVTIMLLDQDNVEHVIDAFRPDPNSASFQRPRREMNVASGCPLFCSLAELNKHAYVRDDTMFVKVLVDTSDT